MKNKIFFLVFLFLIVLNINIVDSSLNDSIISCYNFGDNSEDVISHNDLTNYNVAQSSNKKLGNYSYFFNGVNSYLYNSSNFINFNKNSTISMWVYFNGSYGEEPFVLLEQYTDSPTYYIIKIWFTNELDWQNSDVGYILDLNTPLNQWYYLTLTNNDFNGLTYSNYYVNGSYITSFNYSIYDLGSLTIGRSSYYSSFYFYGLIDDMHIYNKSLNSSEILEDYNSGNGLLCSDFFTTEETTTTTTTTIPIGITGSYLYGSFVGNIFSLLIVYLLIYFLIRFWQSEEDIKTKIRNCILIIFCAIIILVLINV